MQNAQKQAISDKKSKMFRPRLRPCFRYFSVHYITDFLIVQRFLIRFISLKTKRLAVAKCMQDASLSIISLKFSTYDDFHIVMHDYNWPNYDNYQYKNFTV